MGTHASQACLDTQGARAPGRPRHGPRVQLSHASASSAAVIERSAQKISKSDPSNVSDQVVSGKTPNRPIRTRIYDLST